MECPMNISEPDEFVIVIDEDDVVPRHPCDTEHGFCTLMRADVHRGFHVYYDEELSFILTHKLGEVKWDQSFKQLYAKTIDVGYSF